MFANDPTTSRVMSGFPLSVGTSLAFESLFETVQPTIDPARVIPQKVNLADYEEFWINLSTLFRNLMGSLSKEQINGVTTTHLKGALLEEIETIVNLITTESMSRVKVTFYLCQYKKLYASETKYFVLKKSSTDNQKIYDALEQQTMDLILKELKQSENIKVYDTEINKEGYLNKKTALIITHAAYDLTSFNNFKKLDLLESHSGVLKPRSLFYTKYLDGKNLSMIPFMKGFFPVFGDSTHFRAIDVRLRRELIAVAVQCNWTQLTTVAKIKDNIQTMKNKLYVDILKELL